MSTAGVEKMPAGSLAVRQIDGGETAAGRRFGGFTLRTAEGRARCGSFLIYLALIIETALVLIDESELPYSSMSLVFRGTFVLSFAALCLKPHGKRAWAALVLLMLFGVICWRITGRNEILRFTVFAAACGGEDLRKLLKTAFFLTLGGCLLIALLSVTHLFGAVSLTADYRMDGGVETRYVLGFGHPNALHCMCLMLMLLAIAIWQQRFRWWHYLLLTAGNAALYLLTDSRTGAAIGFLAIAFSLWMKVLEGGSRGAEPRGGTGTAIPGIASAGPAKGAGEASFAGTDKVLGGASFDGTDKVSGESTSNGTDKAAEKSFRQGLVTAHFFAAAGLIVDAVAFSVWAAKISWDSTNDWASSYPINLKLNGRIAELYYGAVERGSLDAWTLFGSREAERFFDMGFVRLYYWYGILPASLVILAVLLLLALCRRYGETGCLVMITCMALYTVLEAHLVSVFIGRNYLVPIIGVLAYQWFREHRYERATEREEGV